jgi:hypothetical protein
MKTVRAPAKNPRRSTRVSRPTAVRRAAPRRTARAGRTIAVGPEERRRSFVVLALLAGLVAALLWLPSLRWISPKMTLLWTGYQTVAVRGDRFGEAEVSALAARLGPGVVSEATSSADFWDFNGFTRVRYADLDARLDRLDPRRDAYMDGAGAYFRASSRGMTWRVLYVPARLTPLGLSIALSRDIGFPAHGEWRLVDFDPLEKAVSVLAVFVLATLLALSLEQGRRAALVPACAGAALWVPFVLRGGLADLALALGLLLSWFPLLRTFLLLKGWDGQLMKGLRRPLFVYCCAATGGLVLSLLAAGPVASRLVGLLAPLVCSLLALPAFRLITLVTSPWRKPRALFEPVPIVRPSGDAIRGRSVAPFFALISLVVVAIVPMTRGVSLPTPLAVRGATDFSWHSIQKLSRTSRTMHLPDLADFATHAAFQETMGFGRAWRLPSEDERVYVREYSQNPATGTIDARLRRVKVFDETWRKGLRKRADAGSLEALLFAQGRPVAAAIRGPGRALFRELPVTLGVLLALLALLARDLGLGPLIRGNLLRSTMVARRNQTP